MKIIKSEELRGTDRDVDVTGCKSLRILLEKDGMGFSLHKTIIPKGDPQHWHYKNHFEACYCVFGEGELTNLETGDVFHIKPDTTYVLDKHDDHLFQALTNSVVLISIFNPPVKGDESHDSEGSYNV